MHANEIDALYDRHEKVSPSPNPQHPNPQHKLSNSAKHENIWKLRALLDISGSFIGGGVGF